MTLNRSVIKAVVTENRPVPEVAAQYGVSRSWLYEFLARYRVEGEAAFEPRSRRPTTVPSAIPTETAALIVKLRHKLVATGLWRRPRHDRLAPAAPPRHHGPRPHHHPLP